MSHTQYSIVKMDKRHKGFGVFTHYVDFWKTKSHLRNPSVMMQDFNTRRVWCWENFGPGLELDYTTWGTDASWAWWRDTSHMQLYFADASLSAYLLYWD